MIHKIMPNMSNSYVFVYLILLHSVLNLKGLAPWATRTRMAIGNANYWIFSSFASKSSSQSFFFFESSLTFCISVCQTKVTRNANMEKFRNGYLFPEVINPLPLVSSKYFNCLVSNFCQN